MPDRTPNSSTALPLAAGMDTYVEHARSTRSGIGASLAAARLASDLATDLFPPPEAAGLKSVTTFVVQDGQELAVRLHLPAGEERRPGIVYFHGGGFLFGSIESFDSIAKALAIHCDAIVASVQYRRLPENSYGDAQQDCDAVLDWLVEQADLLRVDRTRIAVAGDSVGALLATIAAVRARDRGIALAAQLLLYGAYAMRPGRAAYAVSRDPLLTGDRVEAFIAAWHRAGGPSFHCAPLDMADLSGLPPTVMLAAEHDPLLDESHDFAARLGAAGVPVTHRVAPGMIHGFLRALSVSPPAADEMAGIAAALRQHLSPLETL